MSRERDTTDSGGGGIRLRLLDGGLPTAPLAGGWRVGPGLGAGEGWGTGRDGDGDGDGAVRGAAREGDGAIRAVGRDGDGARDDHGAISGAARESWGAEPPAECVVVRSAVRAGDRHEPWVLPVTGAIAALAGDARTAGVDVELAVRLTVECALVCDDLRSAGAEPAALDAAAATERVTGELDAAAAAYLRRLTGRRSEAVAVRRPAGFAPPAEAATARRPAGFAPSTDGVTAPRPAQSGPARSDAARPDPLGEVVTVGLPVRLSSRLLAADLDALVSAVPLDRALAWETAAVLAGRTMSEWAPLTALRLGG